MNGCANNSLDAVLQVLVIMIFADHIVRNEEVEAVVDILPNLAVFSEGRLASSMEEIQSTVRQHLSKVEASLSSPLREEFIESALAKIDDPFLIPMVLTALHQLARADNEYHQKEERLIVLASDIWGLN